MSRSLWPPFGDGPSLWLKSDRLTNRPFVVDLFLNQVSWRWAFQKLVSGGWIGILGWICVQAACGPYASTQGAEPEGLQEPFFALNPTGPLGDVRGVVFSSDGEQLAVGGKDKVLFRLPTSPAVARRRSSLRWETHEETYGQINTLARESDQDVVVVAGESARGVGHGDLAWFDLQTGRQIAFEHSDDGRGEGAGEGPAHVVLFDCLTDQFSRFSVRGHQGPVIALQGMVGDDWIVSSDVAGGAFARSRKRSAVCLLQANDAIPYAPLRPIALAGPGTVVVPHYLTPGRPDWSRAAWELHLFELPRLVEGVGELPLVPAAHSSAADLRDAFGAPLQPTIATPTATSDRDESLRSRSSHASQALPTALPEPDPGVARPGRAVSSQPDLEKPIAPSLTGPVKQLRSVPDLRPQRRLRGDQKSAALTALALSSTGRWLAAATLNNRILLWDLKQSTTAPTRTIETPEEIALTLAFHPQREELWVGLQHGLGSGRTEGRLRIFEVSTQRRPQPIREFSFKMPVQTCNFSLDGKKYALTQLLERHVYVGETRELKAPPQPLPTIQTMRAASVLADGADYTIYYQMDGPAGLTDPRKMAAQQSSATPGLIGALNLGTLERSLIQALPALPARVDSGWRITREQAGQLELRGPRGERAEVQYDSNKHGRVVARCWFPLNQGWCLALAMEHTHQILVYQPGLTSRLLRRFWGHTGTISSLEPTQESSPRFLVSTATDGTLRLWSLDCLLENDAVWARWGVSFAFQEERLRVERLDDNGPLFQKGVRIGDTIREIQWLEESPDQVVKRVVEPAAMQTALAELAVDRVVTFFSKRGDADRPVFQTKDAWAALLGFVAVDDQWIAWNPVGYYACSAGGSRLIGWQVNQKLGEPPLFFEANQFQERFHRPEAIRKLMRAGQITDALAAVHAGVEREVPEMAAVLPPEVAILLPDPLPPDLEPGSPFRLTGQHQSRSTEPVTSIQLHINGRPAGPPRAIVPTREPVPFEFQVKLPAGSNRVTVTAQTASSLGRSNEVPVTIEPPSSSQPTRPKIYVLLVGISRYKQPAFQLDVPEQDADQLEQIFRQQFCKQVYSEAVIRKLVNEQATLSAMDQALVEMMDSMRAGDKGVVFFSGHGFVEDRFYLAPYDFERERLAQTGLSDQRLTEICTRSQNQLLLILNACHAGAANLLSAKTDEIGARFGRDDYAIRLLAATPSTEKAIQGAFSKVLFDALRGKADMLVEYGIVETNEVSAYLPPNVKQDTQGRQVPVSSNLGEFVEFPLTNTSSH